MAPSLSSMLVYVYKKIALIRQDRSFLENKRSFVFLVVCGMIGNIHYFILFLCYLHPH
jgi:hypothetical protein